MRVTKRFVKNVGCDVVNSGFPDGSLSSILDFCARRGYKLDKKSENMVVLSGFLEISYFEECRASRRTGKERIERSVKTQNQGKQYALANEKKDLSEPFENELPQKENLNDQIAITTLLNEVRNFPLSNKTPMETMLFFAEI